MRYTKTEWIHDNIDDPIVIYSEIDDGEWERRKVEVFRDGSFGYASSAESEGGSHLSEERMPPIDEISRQDEFEPELIIAEEFETVWLRATGGR
jgi:hypothetical protein